MRLVGVVMLDVETEDALELLAIDDQKPVETFAAERANPALRVRVRLRRSERSADDLDVLAPEDLVKAEVNLLSRSWNRNPIGGRSGSNQAICRACRAVQAPSGFGVQPVDGLDDCQVQ